MPAVGAFESMQKYLQTYAHECVHSTGHKKRLDRDLKGLLKDRLSYSKEELVAEFGACDIVGADENNFNYIASRAKVIKEQEREPELFYAIGRASKAVEFIKTESMNSLPF